VVKEQDQDNMDLQVEVEQVPLELKVVVQEDVMVEQDLQF
jgi:hypothetical protein